jgi:hypothetical protein
MKEDPMGFKRTYEDSLGTVYTEVYYRVVGARLEVAPRQAARVEVAIYRNKAARDADKPPFQRKVYATATAEEFAQFFGTAALSAAEMNPVKAGYLLAKAKINDPSIVDVI